MFVWVSLRPAPPPLQSLPPAASVPRICGRWPHLNNVYRVGSQPRVPLHRRCNEAMLAFLSGCARSADYGVTELCLGAAGEQHAKGESGGHERGGWIEHVHCTEEASGDLGIAPSGTMHPRGVPLHQAGAERTSTFDFGITQIFVTPRQTPRESAGGACSDAF